MVDSQIVNEWIEKADSDFQFAQESLQTGSKFYHLICFHFQQAAEKYLKAYIVAYELEFKKTHDLGELVQICQIKSSKFKNFKKEADFLTDFYLEPRYPEGFPSATYTKGDATKAKNAAQAIGNFVKRLLRT